jgi:hypothetical protein
MCVYCNKNQPKNVNPDVFHKHFKEAASDSNAVTKTNPLHATDNSCSFDEFDCEITETEITEAVKRLKKEKSHGTDLLINEKLMHYEF